MLLHYREENLKCTNSNPNICITETNANYHNDDLDLLEGLSSSPKFIPTRFCYDDIGSQLFTQRCQQPEYYLMRTEQQILINSAKELRDIIGPATICDFGSGSAEKIPIILDAFFHHDEPVTYVPIDINHKYLELGAQALLRQFPKLNVYGLRGTYEQALSVLPTDAAPKILLMLGSTIGNMTDLEINELYKSVWMNLSQNDYLLIGADLDKDPAILEAAYNDAAGIGAKMELNVLVHLNRVFDGNFKVENYTHNAVYVSDLKRVEARLYSKLDHHVALESISVKLNIREGEYIRTDIMRKFVSSSFIRLMKNIGFAHCKTFHDVDELYGLFLFQRS